LTATVVVIIVAVIVASAVFHATVVTKHNLVFIKK
jgi:hypothetical protein